MRCRQATRNRCRSTATLPVPRRHAHLDRTDPHVAAVARYLLDAALDPEVGGPRPARRCGVMRTSAVPRRTTLLLARFRFQLALSGRDGRRSQVAEDAQALAYRGKPDAPDWLPPEEVAALLAAEPSGNVPADLARDDLERAVAALDALQPHLAIEADALAERLATAHTRVRAAARMRGITVTAHTPVDVLGVYLYLPTVAS